MRSSMRSRTLSRPVVAIRCPTRHRIGHHPAEVDVTLSIDPPPSRPQSEAMPTTPTDPEPHDAPADGAWMTEPLDATVHLAFAFDIGDAIDLDRARRILQGEPGQLPRRRRTPESIGYRPAPIRVEVSPDGLRLPGDPSMIRPPRAELTLFDFAAISLSVQFPLTACPADLLELAGRLAEPAPLTEATHGSSNPGSSGSGRRSTTMPSAT